MKSKNITEIIKQMDQISKDLDNFINADSDYSKLNEKLKDGTISKEEKETFKSAFNELPYWANKIDDSVNKITNGLKNSAD